MGLSLQDVVHAVQARQVTQAALAAEAGVTQAAISYLCTGTTKSPTYENAIAIIEAAERLGIKKAKAAGPNNQTQKVSA